MYIINDINYNVNEFTMIRGDSFSYSIKINSGTPLYPIIYNLSENDKLYVGIMEPNQSFENAIIKKVYNNNSEKDEEGNILLLLSPEDTEYLTTGLYYIQIKLKYEEDNIEKISTILNPTKFYICGTNNETFKENIAWNQ
jgi:hypothetical protein